MQHKKWLVNFISDLSVFMKYGITKNAFSKELFHFSPVSLFLDENSQTNKIEQTEVEPSKSTNLVSEGSVILGGKTKKTGGKKSKSVQISEPSSIQTQPIQLQRRIQAIWMHCMRRWSKKAQKF
ncbi:unnamed protein product [Rhizophagus irregularis]|nr:unnamed protein product [Rhizophagus irregularis]